MHAVTMPIPLVSLLLCLQEMLGYLGIFSGGQEWSRFLRFLPMVDRVAQSFSDQLITHLCIVRIAIQCKFLSPFEGNSIVYMLCCVLLALRAVVVMWENVALHE